ncbi:expressed unknown protein [Seminavis robusta]|uniref:Uncharacterized protein n=1 Tax=Seminavis robusta TaxID=568900 RepID=A0A9N8E4N0_9STRA|nr:expressed unknown protein [Seminavis robusta]|eukprot:Sro662_g183370.1 n/a (264) ;mRNA; f:26331-27122
MGAVCSIHNDTVDETVMVYIGVNTKVLQPLLWSITGLATALSGGVAVGTFPAAVSVTVAGEAVMVSVSAITAAAGGLVSASNFVLEALQTKLVNDLTKGGYHKLLPGQTYTTQKLSPALNLRVWLVRIHKTENAILIKRCDSSVWTGTKPGSANIYRVRDKLQFRHWKSHETIPTNYQYIPKETQQHGTEEEEEKKEQHTQEHQDHGHDSEDHEFTILNSGMVHCQCKIVETTHWPEETNGDGQHQPLDDSDAWVQVDAVTDK